jgi:hypothetical protein
MNRWVQKIWYVVLITFAVSCGLPHYHNGMSFITNPSLELFGSNLDIVNGKYVVKSYFQSSIIGRTEYIYEYLVLEFLDSVVAGKKYDIPVSGIKIQYDKGGQAGQISSIKAKGVITVLEVSDSVLKLDCDLEFSSFTLKGNYNQVPDTIKRKGILTAKKGYRLY